MGSVLSINFLAGSFQINPTVDLAASVSCASTATSELGPSRINVQGELNTFGFGTTAFNGFNINYLAQTQPNGIYIDLIAADLTVIQTVSTDTTYPVSSSFTGSTSLSKPLASALLVASTSTSHAKKTISLAASLVSVASTLGSINQSIVFLATLLSESTSGSGTPIDLSVGKPLEQLLSVEGTSTSESYLSTPIASVASCSTALLANLNQTVQAQASLVQEGSVAGDTLLGKGIASSIGFVASSIGDLSASKPIQASIGLSATSISDVLVGNYQASDINSSSSISSQMSLSKPAEASLLNEVLSTGDLVQTINAEADLSIEATGSGELVIGLVLGSSISSATSTEAELHSQVNLSKAEYGVFLNFSEATLEVFQGALAETVYTCSVSTSGNLQTGTLLSSSIGSRVSANTTLSITAVLTSLAEGSCSVIAGLNQEVVMLATALSESNVLDTQSGLNVVKYIESSTYSQSSISAYLLDRIALVSSIGSVATATSQVAKNINAQVSIEGSASTTVASQLIKPVASTVSVLGSLISDTAVNIKLASSIELGNTNVQAEVAVDKPITSTAFTEAHVASEIGLVVKLAQAEPGIFIEFVNGSLEVYEGATTDTTLHVSSSVNSVVHNNTKLSIQANTQNTLHSDVNIAVPVEAHLLSAVGSVSAINQNVVLLATLRSDSSSGDTGIPVELSVDKPVQSSIYCLVSSVSEVKQIIKANSAVVAIASSVAGIKQVVNASASLFVTSTTISNTVQQKRLEVSSQTSTAITAGLTSRLPIATNLVIECSEISELTNSKSIGSSSTSSVSAVAEILNHIHLEDSDSGIFMNFTSGSLDVYEGSQGSKALPVASTVEATLLYTRTLSTQALSQVSSTGQISLFVPIAAFTSSSCTVTAELQSAVSIASVGLVSSSVPPTTLGIDKQFQANLYSNAAYSGQVSKRTSLAASTGAVVFAAASVKQTTVLLSTSSSQTSVGDPATHTVPLSIAKSIGSVGLIVSQNISNISLATPVDAYLQTNSTSSSNIVKSVGLGYEPRLLIDFTQGSLTIVSEGGSSFASGNVHKQVINAASLSSTISVASADVSLGVGLGSSSTNQAKLVADVVISKAIQSSLIAVTSSAAQVKLSIPLSGDHQVRSFVDSVLLINKKLYSDLGVVIKEEANIFVATTKVNPYRLVTVPFESNSVIVPVFNNGVIVPIFNNRVIVPALVAKFNNSVIVPREKDLV